MIKIFNKGNQSWMWIHGEIRKAALTGAWFIHAWNYVSQLGGRKNRSMTSKIVHASFAQPAPYSPDFWIASGLSVSFMSLYFIQLFIHEQCVDTGTHPAGCHPGNRPVRSHLIPVPRLLSNVMKASVVRSCQKKTRFSGFGFLLSSAPDRPDVFIFAHFSLTIAITIFVFKKNCHTKTSKWG